MLSWVRDMMGSSQQVYVVNISLLGGSYRFLRFLAKFGIPRSPNSLNPCREILTDAPI